jgi:hypothetical protein
MSREIFPRRLEVAQKFAWHPAPLRTSPDGRSVVPPHSPRSEGVLIPTDPIQDRRRPMKAGGGYWFSALSDLSTATVRHCRGEAKRWRRDAIGKRATRESDEG